MPAEKKNPNAAKKLKFEVRAGGKKYTGNLETDAGPEPITLPMLINGLMVNLAKDCPEIHEAESMTLKVSLC